MANTHKGRYFYILFLVFMFTSPRIVVDSSLDPPQHDQENEQHHAPFQEPESSEKNSKLSQQEVLLYKLEELVKNLSEIVAKLEPKLIESTRVVQVNSRGSQELEKITEIGLHGKKSFEEEGLEDKLGSLDKSKAAGLVTKYSPSWSERFQFVSAVKLESYATSVNVLPFRDFEGLSKYVAIGDDKGRVYVFLRNGDVLVEFHTSSDSPITSMVSHLSVYKNESIVVTGHENGMILIHKIYELANGEEWSSIIMENVGKCESNSGEQGVPVTILEVHHVGRLRYILSSDASGKIRVFRENGTLHGSALAKSKPLAFLKQRLLFLTESGAGSLDLRSMRIRESDCESLNNSLVRSYVFDAAERSKAYGITSEGDLIHVLLLGDVMNFKCRVRSKKNVGVDEPLALQAIKGYLLIANGEKVFVYNVSSPHYVRTGGPRPLFSSNLDEIRLSFLNFQAMDGHDDEGSTKGIPLIASDREKLIILGLGGAYVGMYCSNLPVFKGEFNSMLWTSPVLLFILFLFGAWQFFAKKKEALTSWGPDDPFSSTSATTVAPLGSGSGDRSYGESPARNSDIMDLRASGLGGPPRRYASPPQYPGGATGSFRPTTDNSSRSNSVDPRYRASSELKFRGPALESTAFANRRENLFSNNQVAEESN